MKHPSKRWDLLRLLCHHEPRPHASDQVILHVAAVLPDARADGRHVRRARDGRKQHGAGGVRVVVLQRLRKRETHRCQNFTLETLAHVPNPQTKFHRQQMQLPLNNVLRAEGEIWRR